VITIVSELRVETSAWSSEDGGHNACKQLTQLSKHSTFATHAAVYTALYSLCTDDRTRTHAAC